jgi:Ni,Fe-hydrogenase III large subunit/Ni,Fe-hydrogenase III component G
MSTMADGGKMKLEGFDIEVTRLPGAVPVFGADVDAAEWSETCQRVAEHGGRVVALWGSDRRHDGSGLAVHVALAVREGLLVLAHSLAGMSYPDVAVIFPAADRMQRAAHDLLGITAEGAVDQRKWLRHAAWGEDEFPLRKDFKSNHQSPITNHASQADEYPFVRVEGEGVHEIPVGPVHAGTIEPGHFRFSIIGERVLRLEERLGYAHKGIEKRFEGMTPEEGARLAGRVSGDSTVAFAWAYAMAIESAAAVTPPPRALWLRALLLERERIANHLGDLGFLGNDAGLAFGLSQLLILKEEWLRANAAAFGHRYLMDSIVPGGVARDLAPDAMQQMKADTIALESSLDHIKSVYDEHAGLQDRFIQCGVVLPALAARLGLAGLAGRASAQAWDLRVDHPCIPYRELDVRMTTHRNGDVAARVTVRFEEVFESLRLIRLILDRLSLGESMAALQGVGAGGAFGVGWVEGWRGEVLVAIEIGPDNRIRRCHPHDPSWQSWPLIEHAVIGNIVPDFPLINKSFNLSYSGQDL